MIEDVCVIVVIGKPKYDSFFQIIIVFNIKIC